VEGVAFRAGWFLAFQRTKGQRFFPAELLEIINTLPEDNLAGDEDSLERFKTAVLLRYLMTFYEKRSAIAWCAEEYEVARKCGFPQSVAVSFLALFCDRVDGEALDGSNQAFAFSKASTNKIMLWILVLYVVAHRKCRAADIGDLLRSLDYDVKKGRALLREAGMKVSSGKGGKVGAALVLPLVFPKPKRSAKKV
jgi:hypothetical protein